MRCQSCLGKPNQMIFLKILYCRFLVYFWFFRKRSPIWFLYQYVWHIIYSSFTLRDRLGLIVAILRRHSLPFLQIIVYLIMWFVTQCQKDKLISLFPSFTQHFTFYYNLFFLMTCPQHSWRHMCTSPCLKVKPTESHGRTGSQDRRGFESSPEKIKTAKLPWSLKKRSFLGLFPKPANTHLFVVFANNWIINVNCK